MEVLLFSLFFISVLIFFIAGKDDFGRTESKSIIKEEVKEEETFPPEENKDQKVNEKEKITSEGNIEPKEDLKKEA